VADFDDSDRKGGRKPAPGRVSATENYGGGNGPYAPTLFPGKASRTEQLAPREGSLYASDPAQWSTDHEADASARQDPAQIAAHATRGSGGPLPHLSLVQSSVGRHDVSGVQSFVGGRAGAAAGQLGANAFAFGNNVAFKEEPDLHTAAHEAAHVVQQRSGVALKAGVSSAGDEYEQHADQVADAVVRGESAEPLLEQMTGRGANAAPATPVVQRKEETAPARRNSTSHEDYVYKYRGAILAAVADRINTVGVPEPHARLRWHTAEAGAQAIAKAVREYVDSAAPELTLMRLAKLAYPADLVHIVDGARRGPGGVQEVGLAVAIALDAPIAASIQRMGARVVAYRDAHGGSPPKAFDIVASSPLDGAIATALAGNENIVPNWHKPKNDDAAAGRPFAKGVVEVEFTWMGKTDPNLWNWIHVTAPKNATVEHVAHTELAPGYVPQDGSEQAYRIAASPPYFGIPFEIAKQAPDAFNYAPEQIKAQLKGDNTGPQIANDTALGNSVSSREAALAQAPKPKKTDEPAARTVERCWTQIEFLATQLGRWKLAGPLAGARQFIGERRIHIATDPKEATRWQSVLAMQERILHAASSDVGEINDDLAARGARPEDRAALGPILRVLEAYARAGAVSHLGAQGPEALAKARLERELLPYAMTEQTIQLAGRGIVTEAGSQTEKEDAAAYNDLTKRAAEMRLKLAHGETVSADDQDRLSIEAEALATRARIGTLETEINALMKEADRVGEPQADYEWNLPTVRALPNALRKKFPGWRQQIDEAVRATDAELSPTLKHQRIAQVNQAIDRFSEEAETKKWFEWAKTHIKKTELNNLINSIALQLGIMIITGEIAGAAVAAVRGVALASELITEVREASLLLKAGEVLIHAGLNTGAQSLAGGPAGVKDFGENALGIVLGHAAMKPFLSLLRESSVVEQEVAAGWKAFAKNGAKLAIEFSLETGTGIAASALAHVAMHSGELSISSSQEWLTQGISIAASKFVHQRTARMQERISEAIKEHGSEKFEKLKAKVDSLAQRSNKENHSPDEARSQLIESEKLLIEEGALYGAKDLVGSHNNAKERSALGEDFLEVPLQLQKMSPIVDGHIYEGTAKQAKDAADAARAMGMDATIVEGNDGVWRITVGKRTIEIHGIGPTKGQQHTGGHLHEPPGVQKPLAGTAHDDGPTRIADQMPDAHDVTPDSWMQLQHLIRTHGKERGLREWRNLEEGRTADGLEINATIVPGSAFIGTGRPTAEPAAVQAAAARDFTALRNVFPDQIASIGANGHTFTVRLSDHTVFKVTVMATNLSYHQVARSQVNTQKGEHTIQLSSRVAEDQIPRALAHEVGEIIAETQSSRLRRVREPDDLLDPAQGRTTGALSPHDWGRIAEVNLLAAQLADPALLPARRTALRRELIGLVDAMGLRQVDPNALKRRAALVRERALSPTANDALFNDHTGLARPATELSAEDLAARVDIEKTARDRDASNLENEKKRQGSSLEPLAPGKNQLNIEGRVSAAEQHRIAIAAEQARAQKSEETLKWLRGLHAHRAPGADHAEIDAPVWIGGGASTTGLTPETLFIDDRGRWQQDVSPYIAQTAQQLSDVRTAGMGDPLQFARPDERVPMDVIRAFEDHLAAQARVLNGRASVEIDANGRTLITVHVKGESLTFVLKGNRPAVFATGFPRESVSGQRMPLHQAVRVLRDQMASLGLDPRRALGTHTGASDADAAQVGAALKDSPEAAAIEAHGSAEAKQALESLLAVENWETARKSDRTHRRVLRGDEANLISDYRKTGVTEWIIAGQGGTAISTAEVILKQTRGMKPPVNVHLLGRDNPEGLRGNTQWKEVEAKYGPAGENRLFVEQAADIGTISVDPTTGAATGFSVRDGGTVRTVSGNGFIVALGREGLLPSPIADHVLATYNEQHGTPPVPGSKVAGQLLWGTNGQYLGYRVVTTRHGHTSTFDITGAQSRFLPPELFPSKRVREMVAPERRSTTPVDQTARGRDASASSGNFDGGFGPSATQAHDYTARTSDGSIRVMDADGNFL
jgi:hypothetical protein